MLCASSKPFSVAIDGTDKIWGGPDNFLYEGESNENRKTEIEIRNVAPLSYKLADMLPML
jgi:hypothetical protein